MTTLLLKGHALTTLLVLALVSLAACASSKPGRAPGKPEVLTSPAQDPASVDMLDVGALIPDMQLDMRYAGSDNFVGRPIPGYDAPKCYLLRQPAQALAQVQSALRAQGLSLLIYDCYRPVRAVQAFVAWAHDPADQVNKARFYPDIDKPKLLDGYIAEKSGHSRGATVDLTVVRCEQEMCTPLDMGTDHDWFGVQSHTDNPQLTEVQRSNRKLLVDAMAAAGYVNYPMEWWHFTWQPEPTPHTAYDFPVQ